MVSVPWSYPFPVPKPQEVLPAMLPTTSIALHKGRHGVIPALRS